MRLSNDEIFERAFFPRLMWCVTDACFPDDHREIVKAFWDDMGEWLDLSRNKTQHSEVKADLDRNVNGLIEHMIDKQTGALLTSKFLMVCFGLCILAAERKDEMFTDRFSDALNQVNDIMQEEATKELAQVEASAQKSLRRALKWLHGRFKFRWIEI